jgi:hypothetical protein
MRLRIFDVVPQVMILREPEGQDQDFYKESPILRYDSGQGGGF